MARRRFYPCLLLMVLCACNPKPPTNNITYSPDLPTPLFIKIKDVLSRQITQCWATPTNAPVVTIYFNVLKDGTATDIHVIPTQQKRYDTEPQFRAAADRAMHAVHQCSPLKDLPADKYEFWKKMMLTFDPSQL